MLRTCPEMVRLGMASNVNDVVWLAASRAASVSANGIPAEKLMVSSITMKPDEPDPAPPEDGSGASDPGAWAVPDPAPSPGTPLMLIATPDVGAVRVVWFSAACAACTWAWAVATC